MAGLLVIVTVLIFDMIAFGLAISAEQRRSKAQVLPDPEKYYTYCVYDSDIATGYGAGAFVLLFLSQLLIVVVSKCFCCGRPLKPGGSRACAVLMFISCWFTFIIAEICLLAASVQNAYHTKYRAMFNIDHLSCETIRKGVFAAGAAFTFFTGILSELYYITYSKANASPYHGGEDGMGMSSYR
ncbi:unnamed protein product [Victoria cruziana]